MAPPAAGATRHIQTGLLEGLDVIAATQQPQPALAEGPVVTSPRAADEVAAVLSECRAWPPTAGPAALPQRGSRPPRSPPGAPPGASRCRKSPCLHTGKQGHWVLTHFQASFVRKPETPARVNKGRQNKEHLFREWITGAREIRTLWRKVGEASDRRSEGRSEGRDKGTVWKTRPEGVRLRCQEDKGGGPATSQSGTQGGRAVRRRSAAPPRSTRVGPAREGAPIRD